MDGWGCGATTMKNTLLKLMQARYGFSSFADFIFERKFHGKNRCARCGSSQIYFKVVLERWVKGKLISKVVIPYCRKCGAIELF
jgi:hypothetical protein